MCSWPLTYPTFSNSAFSSTLTQKINSVNTLFSTFTKQDGTFWASLEAIEQYPAIDHGHQKARRADTTALKKEEVPPPFNSYSKGGKSHPLCILSGFGSTGVISGPLKTKWVVLRCDIQITHSGEVRYPRAIGEKCMANTSNENMLKLGKIFFQAQQECDCILKKFNTWFELEVHHISPLILSLWEPF